MADPIAAAKPSSVAHRLASGSIRCSRAYSATNATVESRAPPRSSRDVTISAHFGQTLVAWPEGSRYPGFIFSRAETPERAEKALREAHALLEFVVSSPSPDGRGLG